MAHAIHHKHPGTAAAYLRLEKITYPDGDREVYYNYSDASGISEMLNRVADIADDDSSNGTRTKYAAYDYLGAEQRDRCTFGKSGRPQYERNATNIGPVPNAMKLSG